MLAWGGAVYGDDLADPVAAHTNDGITWLFDLNYAE